MKSETRPPQPHQNKFFDAITVDLTSGAIAYPEVKGFELDKDRLYSSAARFLPHCNESLALAVKHAIFEQLSAFIGSASFRQLCG